MDTAPEVPRCFGIFPPKVAIYFITLFGLGSGGVGLAGMILYGLVEDSDIAKFFMANPVDEGVKRLVLMTLGLSSLLLFISSFLMFIGIVCRQVKAIFLGAWVLFTLCLILICGAICMPVLCFFYNDTCVIKKVSSFLLTFGYMFVTVFLWIWLYFVTVTFNYLNDVGV